MSNLTSIDRLESDILDESVPLASLLRQVLIMGGRASSESLRVWAQQELKGYREPDPTLPEYRTIVAALKADIMAGPATFTGQEISSRDLPEAAREHVTNDVPITWSVAEIQATVQSAPGGHIRLGGTNMSDLARMMTAHQRELQGSPFVNVTSVYWSASTSALEGILDQVRTRLTEFVAEIRSFMSEGADEPTPEQIRQAVSVINITAGDNSPVNVTSPIAIAGSDAAATVEPVTRKARRGLPSRDSSKQRKA
ncbi:hypothetical protein [Streptomyces sp. H23]|uniref:AbiTii domain-containing protein n=1 Tax=Streptomyces sp. H23 TaxID=2541723 RepID=UPI00106E50D5|nr:hypothetical protein [Streptomyces sp. H23]